MSLDMDSSALADSQSSSIQPGAEASVKAALERHTKAGESQPSRRERQVLVDQAMRLSPDGFATVQEAGALLRLKDEVVIRWIHHGLLPAVRPAQRWLIPVRAVHELIQRAYDEQKQR